jgi:hypothetical protein
MCSSDVSWAELSARTPWIVRCRSGSVWGLGFLGGAVLPGIEFESRPPQKIMFFELSKLFIQSLLGRHANFLQSFNSSIPICKLLIWREHGTHVGLERFHLPKVLALCCELSSAKTSLDF